MARSSASPSWSRLPIEPEAERVRPEAREFADALRSRATAALPRGAGRTYGDSAANSGGALLETGRLSRVISFDAERGRITVEAGVTLAEIHRRTLPSGWVVPCCPGTAAVTVGGMIAHDVHGKNHHATGTLGLHVRSLVLLRSEGEVTCSAAAAPELLRATIGGLGLTGTVMEAELQLQRVPGALVEVTRERHGSLGAAVAALDELGPGDHGYAWVDGFSVDGDRCRAVTFKARTLEGEDPARGRPLAGPLAGLGGLVPASMFRPATVRAFNRVYHLGAAPWAARRELRTSLRAFLFPQDDAHPSNRVYGPRGVYGHHSLVPDLDAARAVLTSIRRSGPLVLVIKRFGDHPAPGMLSFTGPGLSIATGFLNEGERTLTGLAELDELVLSRGGRLYPAKDARMPAAAFARSFPEARAFAAHVDPAFTSNFWRRVRPVA